MIRLGAFSIMKGISSALTFFCVTIALSCSIADKTTFRDSEGSLPESFFSDIRNGKTTQKWIEAQLGLPEEIQQGPGTQQIYNYRFSREQKKHADLFVVLRYDGVASEQTYFHLLFENGIVKKHWHDDYLQVQTDRYFKRLDMQASHNRENYSTQDAGLSLDRVEEPAYKSPAIEDDAMDKNMQNMPKENSTSPIEREALPPEAKKKAPPYPQMKSPSELWPKRAI